MIKVLQLINYPGKGGSERYIASLVKELHQDCVFYCAHSEDGDLLQELEALNVDQFRIPMAGPFDLRAALRLKQLCRQLQIDVVHTHYLRENYIGILARLLGNRAKLVYTRHILGQDTAKSAWANRIMLRFENQIIAVSAAVKQELRALGVPPAKVAVIYNGVDFDYWHDGAGSAIRQELGLPADEFLVTCIGRSAPDKGHSFLLQAIKDFNETGQVLAGKVKFLLVGDGELLEQFQSMVHTSPGYENVIFAGYRRDVRNILHGTDLYVSPSANEALGISVLEALACGVPVVITKVGGQQEIIADGTAGYLIDYGDINRFTEILRQLVGNRELRDRLSIQAQKVVRAKFSLAGMARATLEVYLKTTFTEAAQKRV